MKLIHILILIGFLYGCSNQSKTELTPATSTIEYVDTIEITIIPGAK